MDEAENNKKVKKKINKIKSIWIEMTKMLLEPQLNERAEDVREQGAEEEKTKATLDI